MKRAGFIYFLFIFVVLLSSGCAIHTLTTEYSLPKQSINTPVDSHLSRVIFFNDSNELVYGIDGSGKINVLLNGKALSSLEIHRYVQVFLEKGNYDLHLEHRDIVVFQDDYKIKINEDEVFIKVYSQPTFTEYEIVDELPDGFQKKYKPAY